MRITFFIIGCIIILLSIGLLISLHINGKNFYLSDINRYQRLNLKRFKKFAINSALIVSMLFVGLWLSSSLLYKSFFASFFITFFISILILSCIIFYPLIQNFERFYSDFNSFGSEPYVLMSFEDWEKLFDINPHYYELSLKRLLGMSAGKLVASYYACRLIFMPEGDMMFFHDVYYSYISFKRKDFLKFCFFLFNYYKNINSNYEQNAKKFFGYYDKLN